MSFGALAISTQYAKLRLPLTGSLVLTCYAFPLYAALNLPVQFVNESDRVTELLKCSRETVHRLTERLPLVYSKTLRTTGAQVYRHLSAI